MKRFILTLLFLLFACPSEAAIWLIVNVELRTTDPSDVDLCFSSVSGLEDAYTDQSSCEAQGFTWVEESKFGRYSRGDIIGIKAGDFTAWGNAECGNNPPASGGKFACVNITDKDEAHARNYIKNRLGANLVAIESARFYVNVPALPQAIKDTLWNTGELYKTWAQVKPYIYDKTTGTVIP